MNDKKPRRPQSERKAIRKIMEEKGVKYTTALREFEAQKKELITPSNQVEYERLAAEQWRLDHPEDSDKSDEEIRRA